MKNIIFFLTLALLSGCASAGKYETLKIQSKTILLNQSECKIELKDTQLQLNISGDCHFIKNSNSDSIRTKYYEDINAHVTLIVGDPLPKDPNYPLTMERTDCGSTIKALIVKSNSVYISDKSFSDTVTCAGIGSDEKEYYMLAH